MTESAEKQYEEVIHSHVEESWNEGNYEHLDDHYALNASIIQFGAEHDGGPSYVRKLIEKHRDGFPDLQLKIEDLTVTQATATLHWTFSGTHSEAWHDIEPTGDEVEFSGKSTIQFVGNQISKVHGLPNRLQVLRALGITI